MPPARGSHGVSNADCVTVWFWLRKVKTSVSPTAGRRTWGLKERPWGPPTVTLWVAPVPGATGVPAPPPGTTVGEAATSPGLPATGGVAAAPATVWVTVTVWAWLRTVVGWPPPRLTQRKLTETPLPGVRPSKLCRLWRSTGDAAIPLTATFLFATGATL